MGYTPHRRHSAIQGRDEPIALFKLTTGADSDDPIRVGGRRWGAYLRRNMRTYSSTSREVLSALKITNLSNRNVFSVVGRNRGFGYIHACSKGIPVHQQPEPLPSDNCRRVLVRSAIIPNVRALPTVEEKSKRQKFSSRKMSSTKSN